MQSLMSRYKIHANVEGFPLVIKDLGPWDRYRTVTNDAENVVRDIMRKGLLSPGRPLYYIDSEGSMDEILIEDSQFAGFRIIEAWTPLI